MALNVDPKRLIELLRIADRGSFTLAAAALGVSQPALSNSVAVLEKMLGVRVFDRTRNGATLTEFGRLLAGHAAAIDSVLSRAVDELEAKKRGLEGSLVVGVSPIACIDIVPAAVARQARNAEHRRFDRRARRRRTACRPAQRRDRFGGEFGRVACRRSRYRLRDIGARYLCRGRARRSPAGAQEVCCDRRASRR